MSVLVLTNEEVRTLVPPAAYVDAIERAYRELGNGRAVVQPRIDLYSESPAGNQYCVFKTMVGTLAKDHVAALRINSDVVSWTRREGNLRKEKIPAAEGGRWVGLLFVFDTLSGELKLIVPDGEIQRCRVAATTAVAARHLARRDARTVAIYGSGSQAEGAVYTMGAAFPGSAIRLWSPNPERRRALAKRAAADGLTVEATDTAAAAATGADIVITATNALDAVVRWDWLAPGAFIACVKAQELGDEILAKADRIVIHTRDLEPTNYMAGQGPDSFKDTDFVDRLFGEKRGDGNVASDVLERIARTAPELADVVSGKVEARARAGERVVFLNPVGNGLQFAAVARQLIAAAEKSGVGQRLPAAWFSEDMHP